VRGSLQLSASVRQVLHVSSHRLAPDDADSVRGSGMLGERALLIRLHEVGPDASPRSHPDGPIKSKAHAPQVKHRNRLDVKPSKRSPSTQTAAVMSSLRSGLANCSTSTEC